MFENPLEYRQLNSGAHRRRATNLRAPALVWHSAFWIPASVRGRRVFKRTLADFLLALSRTLAAATEAHDILCNHCVPDALVLFECIGDRSNFQINDAAHNERQTEMRDRDYPVVTVDFHWYGLIFTVRAELHLEYFAFTIFAEVGSGSPPEFLGLEEHFSSLKALLTGDDTIPLEQLSDYFYDDFWQRLFDNMFAEEDLRDYRRHSIFTRIFADFRGLVLSNEIITFPFFDQEGVSAFWRSATLRSMRRTTKPLRSKSCSINL
jgi:hypothetical protein